MHVSKLINDMIDTNMYFRNVNSQLVIVDSPRHNHDIASKISFLLELPTRSKVLAAKYCDGCLQAWKCLDAQDKVINSHSGNDANYTCPDSFPTIGERKKSGR